MHNEKENTQPVETTDEQTESENGDGQDLAEQTAKTLPGPTNLDQDKPVWPGVIQWIKDLFLAAAVCILVIAFIVQPFRVEKTSMEPLLHDGDRILVSKISLWFEPIDRGDIVVLMNPRNPDESWIKRVIGLPGEVIQLYEGDFYINGIKLEEEYIPDIEKTSKNIYPPLDLIKFAHRFRNRPASRILEEMGLIFMEEWETDAGITVAARIPEGYYFVVGDHRRYSMDSRDSIYITRGNGPGMIPERYIYGKAIFRYWPLESIGGIQKPNYENDLPRK
jgi:signal peptidase I